MIRLALPKGRNFEIARAALERAGFDLGALDLDSRSLRHRLPGAGLELLLLKDRDLPLYVERGVADCGVVGRDVLDEVDGDLLVPLELAGGRCRLSLIGPAGAVVPRSGAQVRLATKYPRSAERYLARQPWSAEVLELSGSIELAPLLGLSDFILDIVQTGATLAAHGLTELAVVRQVAPCLVVHRAAWQTLRGELGELIARLEGAGVAA
jgi:ATP phosphoribosyltransferase